MFKRGIRIKEPFSFDLKNIKLIQSGLLTLEQKKLPINRTMTKKLIEVIDQEL